MTKDEIIQKLRASNRAKAAAATGLSYGYISKVVYGEIANPGFEQMDKLRAYLLAEEVKRDHPR